MVLLVVLILSALAVSTHAWFSPTAAVAEPVIAPMKVTTPAQPSAAAQGNSSHKALEAEIVTIRPFGFEPAEISRPHGRFILMVDNRSGIGDVELQLNRETGAHLHQVRVPRAEQDWNDVFDLPPGQYVLREAGHPEWSCRITITAQ
jgi:hypothetical protein